MITKKTKLITCSAVVPWGMRSGVPTQPSTMAVPAEAPIHTSSAALTFTARVSRQKTMKSSSANMKLTSGTRAMQVSCSSWLGMVWGTAMPLSRKRCVQPLAIKA